MNKLLFQSFHLLELYKILHGNIMMTFLGSRFFTLISLSSLLLMRPTFLFSVRCCSGPIDLFIVIVNLNGRHSSKQFAATGTREQKLNLNWLLKLSHLSEIFKKLYNLFFACICNEKYFKVTLTYFRNVYDSCKLYSSKVPDAAML